MAFKFNRLYDYPRSMRTLVGGKRHYDIREEKLPSVTTILSACQSDEKKASLEAWRQRLGPKTADIARDLAAERGTAMHKYLEAYIDGSGHKDLTPLGEQAEKMGKKVIELEHGEKFNLSDDFSLYVYAADDCNPEECFKFLGCNLGYASSILSTASLAAFLVKAKYPILSKGVPSL